jgi:hypothetical protein
MRNGKNIFRFAKTGRGAKNVFVISLGHRRAPI